jgi:hypothetical protein
VANPFGRVVGAVSQGERVFFLNTNNGVKMVSFFEENAQCSMLNNQFTKSMLLTGH